MLRYPQFASQLKRKRAQGHEPIAAVIPRGCPLAETATEQSLGLVFATDPHLHPYQVIFFDDMKLYQRYLSGIPCYEK